MKTASVPFHVIKNRNPNRLRTPQNPILAKSGVDMETADRAFRALGVAFNRGES